MRRFYALGAALLALSTCAGEQIRPQIGSQIRSQIRRGIPTAQFAHRMGFIDRRVQPTLDSLFRTDTVEWVIAVEGDYMARLVGPNPEDSAIVITAISPKCAVDSATYRAVWGPRCRRDALPTIHPHLNGACNPSRADLFSQWANRRDYDVLYCGKGAWHTYWLAFNPYEIAMRVAFGQPPFPPPDSLPGAIPREAP